MKILNFNINMMDVFGYKYLSFMILTDMELKNCRGICDLCRLFRLYTLMRTFCFSIL